MREEKNMNNDGKKSGGGWGFLIFIVIILILAMIGSGMENDYEKAGKDFSTWTKQDPSTWTDTQNQYFNDFWEWSSKN